MRPEELGGFTTVHNGWLLVFSDSQDQIHTFDAITKEFIKCLDIKFNLADIDDNGFLNKLEKIAFTQKLNSILDD